MRALIYDEYGATPRLTELPDPVCPDDGVVVRVGATGVCRSDWHAWRGHDPVPLPMVPGHELAGVVEQVGTRVRSWSPGERVTVPFVCGCGRCPWCRSGQAQVCPDQRQPGFTDHGSYAELVALRAADTNLVRLPDAVGMVEAAALGCRFATAWRGLTARGELAEGQWLAVHGCGGVGLSAVMIGVAFGARVIAVDLRSEALALASELGAAAVVDAGDVPDPASAVRDLSDGGAHVSIDAAGSALTAAASVRSLRRRGRHVQAGLLLGDQAAAPLPMDRVIGWELSVHGTHGMAAVDYPAMLDRVADGSLDPGRLVGRVVGMEQAAEVLTAADSGPGLTVVEPGR